MAKASLSQRSKKYLEDLGYLVGAVEQVIPHTFIRRDLFGLFDLVAIKDGTTIAVQVTSASNIMARVHKIEESENLPTVRKANWGLFVHGWKQNKEGKWTLKEIDIS